MACLELCLNWENITLAQGAWLTVASIEAPQYQMIKVKSIVITANGVAGDAEHLEMRLKRIQRTTGTGTATTPIKLDDAQTCTPQSTCRINFTVEPTLEGTTPYLFPHRIHPQGSSVRELSFDNCRIKEYKELALEIKIPSGGASCKTSGHIVFEE